MAQRLAALRARIESMPNCHQIEVLRIISDVGVVTVSENKNGSFINLTEAPDEMLTKLEEYVQYVERQQKTLKEQEVEKDRLTDAFFNRDKESDT